MVKSTMLATTRLSEQIIEMNVILPLILKRANGTQYENVIITIKINISVFIQKAVRKLKIFNL